MPYAMKNSSLWSTTMIFFMALALSVWSQVSIQTQVNKDKIRVGDKFNYTIQVTYPDSGSVDMPGIQGNLSDFEVRNAKVSNPEKKGMEMVRTWTFELSAFGTGSVIIPAQSVEYTTKGQTRPQVFYSDSVQVNVVSSGGEKMPDILGEETPIAPEKNMSWIFWTLAAVAVALLLFILFSRLKQHQDKANPLLPPYEEALEELALVRKQNWIHGHQSEYFFALSNILRRYFSRIYSIDALESTSDELIQKMEQNLLFPQSEMDRLSEFLAQSDLVKFGRVELPVSVCLHLESQLLYLLESTRSTPSETPNA